MLLCLDIGNSHIFGGIFEKEAFRLSFRYSSAKGSTSDQIGVFLKGIFRENGFSASEVTDIAICSVVPHLNYSLRSACVKYFKKEPFVLQAGTRTGLRIIAKSPSEIGADRIANSIGATHLYPDKNIIIIDFGTATTFCAINAKRDYLGGPILAGLRISMESLTAQAAMLSPVDIVSRPTCLGRTSAENIQSGLYFGQLGAVKEVIQRLQDEAFQGVPPVLLATGGFAHLFEREQLFTALIPNLVFYGLQIALTKNR